MIDEGWFPLLYFKIIIPNYIMGILGKSLGFLIFGSLRFSHTDAIEALLQAAASGSAIAALPVASCLSSRVKKFASC